MIGQNIKTEMFDDHWTSLWNSVRRQVFSSTNIMASHHVSINLDDSVWENVSRNVAFTVRSMVGRDIVVRG